MLYVKPKKMERPIEDDSIDNLVEDRNTSKLYSKGYSLRFRIGLVFMSCSIIILIITLFTVQTILSFQKWNQNWYLATHPLIKVDGAKGYKSHTTSITFSLPVTVEKQPEKIVYIPVTSVSKEAVVTKKEDKEQLVKASGLSKIVRGVWILESNQGQNNNTSAHHNDCTKVGMTNEFGYRALENFCFSSFEESVGTVTSWFEKNLKTYSLNEALCLYSSGVASSTCSYAINYAQLDSDGKLAAK